MSEHIVTQCEQRVLTIEMRRPEKKNALSVEMYAAMAEAFAFAATAREVRVVLLRGQPDCFTAGNDIADFSDNPLADDGPVNSVIEHLLTFTKPVVAAVGGPAIGIGTTMLLHCDLVLAATNAKFALPFVNLGVCPESGSSLLLSRIAGEKRAAKLMLMGEIFSAEVAQECGVVTEVCSAEELIPRAHEAATTLASKPARALRETKALIRGDLSAIRTQVERENAVFAELLHSPAAQEAMSAFLERRKPDFSSHDD